MLGLDSKPVQSYLFSIFDLYGPVIPIRRSELRDAAICVPLDISARFGRNYFQYFQLMVMAIAPSRVPVKAKMARL